MNHRDHVGWIGTGRMGSVLADRLLAQGVDLTVYNRTRSKAEPLARRGARIVDHPADLADQDIVIISVAGSNDFAEVIKLGDQVMKKDKGNVTVLTAIGIAACELKRAPRAKATYKRLPESNRPPVKQACDRKGIVLD